MEFSELHLDQRDVLSISMHRIKRSAETPLAFFHDHLGVVDRTAVRGLLVFTTCQTTKFQNYKNILAH